MDINGQLLPSLLSVNDSLRRLRASAGNCTLLPEFSPVRFAHRTYIWRLLYQGFLSRYMLSRRQFRALHGWYFQLVY